MPFVSAHSLSPIRPRFGSQNWPLPNGVFSTLYTLSTRLVDRVNQRPGRLDFTDDETGIKGYLSFSSYYPDKPTLVIETAEGNHDDYCLDCVAKSVNHSQLVSPADYQRVMAAFRAAQKALQP